MDAGGSLVLVNSAFARLAEMSRGQIIGCSWSTMVRSSHADPAPSLEKLLTGPLQVVSSAIHPRSGRQLTIVWASTPIGEGAGSGAIVRVLRAIDRARVLPPVDLSYRLHQELDFTVLETGPDLPTLTTTTKCYQLFGRTASVCKGCPAVDLPREVGAFQSAVIDTNPNMPIASSSPVGSRTSRSRWALRSSTINASTRSWRCASTGSRRVPNSAHASAKSSTRSSKAVRPRRSPTDSGISVSTVKFHQRKVLRKLEVDSRSELMERVL